MIDKHIKSIYSIFKRQGVGQLIFVIAAFLLVVIIFTQCDNRHSSVSIPKKVDFNFDVRPILVRNCYLCHGPDPSSRKVDLRLDTYEGATTVREDGITPIFPGNLKKSELVRRINHHDPELVMPPPETNMKLSEYEIAVLEKWIDQGAQWTPHWSFIAPENDPSVESDINESKIDSYINREIKQSDIKPAPPADIQKLLRRVSYILTGLPPSPEMISKYLNSDDPGAYEQMVDYYLSSPAFGERWARHWMDVVRYAETKGHEFDYTIMNAWQYRDYLVKAFNEDIPYDQLVKEHLAGDLISAPRQDKVTGNNESRLGTMFYTFSEGKHSPVDTKKEEADRIDNMIDVTSKAFQGLTVSCARCHDHKFDPIPTADYYALYGVMQSTRFSPIPFDLSSDKSKTVQEIQSIKASIRSQFSSEWQGIEIDDKGSQSKSGSLDSNMIKVPDYDVIGDFRGQGLEDWKSDGYAFGNKTTLGDPVFNKDRRKLVGLSTGKASSKTFSTGVFGAIRSPNFTINKDFIGVMAKGKSSSIRIIMDNFQLIQNPIYGELEKKVNNAEMTPLVFNLSAWQGHTAYIEIMPGEYKSHVYRLAEDAFIEAEYVIAFEDIWPEEIKSVDNNENSIDEKISNWSMAHSSASEVNQLNRLLKDGKLKTTFADVAFKLKSIDKLSSKLTDTAFYSGVYEGYGLDSHVFIRGSTDDLSKETVQRGFLSVLNIENNRISNNGSGRLELVEAIVNSDNTLTSRVMVNRIWHHLFGKGIVETVDNFGLQGKLPSHPQLLDHLAIKFVEDGWSIKKMIKYIVMSETFRRSVDGSIDENEVDPDNILLAHFPIRRLEAEAIHDALLTAAGNLNDSMFGPPVPLYLTSFMQGRGRPGKSGPLDGNGRRSIYHEVRRNFLEPMMLTFDRPIPFTTFGNRNVTNVPAQSLIMMNNEFVIQQAKVMAEEIIRLKFTDEVKAIKHIYIKALSREPIETEIKLAQDYIRLLAHSYELNDSEINENIEVWKDYCHSVFNLKEFIYLI